MTIRLGPLVQIDRKRCLSWVIERAPCEEACPIGIRVEEYVNAIEKGDINTAAEIILRDCPLPGVMGRICYRPCEAACKRGKIDESVAIRELKRYATDTGRGKVVRPHPARSARGKVAIIGSGPAGLTCAYYLALKGYEITIFEALPVVGGMLAVGIPEYRLPKEVLAADIRNITDLGVEVKTNTPVVNKPGVIDLLQKGYRAVFIATGAHRGKPLEIPGGNSGMVIQGVDFLRDLNLGKKVQIGQNVAVVGGGNVAFDAARSALRLGCDVTIFYRRSRNEMPAAEEEIRTAECEGIKIEYLCIPMGIRIDRKKKIMECARTRLESVDGTGRKRSSIIPDSVLDLAFDTIIAAVGQKPSLPFTGGRGGLKTTPDETLLVHPATLATPLKGIFAGGDVQSGPSTAVEAMAGGKKAATSIDRYLSGDKSMKGEAKKQITGVERIPRGIISRTGQKPFEIPSMARRQSFKEVNLGFTQDQAVMEAKRCLQCRTCNRCLEQFGCPAIVWRQNEGKFSPHLDEDLCIGCQVCIQVCPFGSILPMEASNG